MEHFIKAAIKLPKSLHQATLRNSAFRGTETVPPSRDMIGWLSGVIQLGLGSCKWFLQGLR